MLEMRMAQQTKPTVVQMKGLPSSTQKKPYATTAPIILDHRSNFANCLNLLLGFGLFMRLKLCWSNGAMSRHLVCFRKIGCFVGTTVPGFSSTLNTSSRSPT